MSNLDNLYNFKPDNEGEKRFTEDYNNISIAMSKILRALPEEQRLKTLKEAEPSDISLMNLYVWARMQEDYEVCSAAKTLLLERGISNIPS